jgi:hypothetical protein
MKQLLKNKGTTWRRDKCRTNIVDRQTYTISHTDLIRTCVCIRGQVEVVQVMSKVVRST